MIPTTLISAALAYLATSTPVSAGMKETRLDVSGIARVVVTGEASTVRLTTETGTAYEATLESRRKGWFAGWHSSWFFNDCAPAGAMKIEDGTLFVVVPSSSFFDFSDCVVELKANIPPGNTITIDQAALLASLNGNYATVTVRSHATDFSLEGDATRIDIKGDAMKTRLEFEGDSRIENIRIDGKALDAYLRFAPDTPISYDIDATASFIDSSLANTPQARPSVLIKGEFVRATIR